MLLSASAVYSLVFKYRLETQPPLPDSELVTKLKSGRIETTLASREIENNLRTSIRRYNTVIELLLNENTDFGLKDLM